jgi:hypothetical protein
MPFSFSASELSDNGRLQIDAFASAVGIPAESAIVRITPHANRNDVIEETAVNSSGQTPPFDLPAPPLDYSMQPSDNKPYSEYDVSVSLAGYETSLIEGVQILPDTISYLNIRLNPDQNYRAQQAESTILIEQHTLWGTYPPKIPEAEVKPLPPNTGFVVLPEPVIPETIIVHNGVPTNASAQNFWVPFKDYIKNVASSEIYATWPVATIRANVLAILSFTLNRIYTEWYRGKGYDFTITNSTAFDHAFVYGRNIFEEISRVVDEIFTSFITKPDIRQPLLTQYCDGKQSQCPQWMTSA